MSKLGYVSTTVHEGKICNLQGLHKRKPKSTSSWITWYYSWWFQLNETLWWLDQFVVTDHLESPNSQDDYWLLYIQPVGTTEEVECGIWLEIFMRLVDILPECLAGSRSSCGWARCSGIWCHIVDLLSQTVCGNDCNAESECQQWNFHCIFSVYI